MTTWIEASDKVELSHSAVMTLYSLIDSSTFEEVVKVDLTQQVDAIQYQDEAEPLFKRLNENQKLSLDAEYLAIFNMRQSRDGKRFWKIRL